MVFYLSPLKPQMGAPGESGNASHLATFSGEVTDRTAPPPLSTFWGGEKKKGTELSVFRFRFPAADTREHETSTTLK